MGYSVWHEVFFLISVYACVHWLIWMTSWLNRLKNLVTNVSENLWWLFLFSLSFIITLVNRLNNYSRFCKLTITKSDLLCLFNVFYLFIFMTTETCLAISLPSPQVPVLVQIIIISPVDSRAQVLRCWPLKVNFQSSSHSSSRVLKWDTSSLGK